MSVFFSQEFPGELQSMEKAATGSTRVDSTRLFNPGVVQIPELGTTLRAKSEFVEQARATGAAGLAGAAGASVQLTPAMLEAAAEKVPRVAVAADVAVTSAAALAGRYHAWRMKSSFPVPGSMVVDDYRRRFLAMYASTEEKVLAPVRRERELAAEARIAVVDRREERRLPSAVERLLGELETVITAKDDAVGANAVAELRVPASADDLALFSLIEQRQVVAVEERFRAGDVNVLAVCPRSGASGLMKAVSLGLLTVVRLYLQAGADPSFTLARGVSCLHCVFDALSRVKRTYSKRRIMFVTARDILTSLLEFGADANKSTPNGLTALHMAAAFGYDDVCTILLRHGADRTLLDRKNRTPQRVAEDKGNKSAAQVSALAQYPTANPDRSR